MNCKKCGELLAENAAVCPVCGEAQQEPERIPEAPVNAEELTQVPEAPVDGEALPAEAGQEAPVEAGEEAPQEAAPAVPDPKRKKLLRVLAIVCCVSLALALALGLWMGINGGLKPRGNDIHRRDDYSAQGSQLLSAMDTVVATCGDAQLTNGQLQIFYWNEVFRFLEQYSSYIAYLGLDLSQPLSQQMYDEETTYEQLFLEGALSNWHSYQSLAHLANQEGYTMTSDLQAQLDAMEDSLAASAAYYGFADAQELIQADMGPGATLESYMEYMELYFYSMDYFDSLYLSFQPDRATVEAYYAENADMVDQGYGVSKDSGKLVDVRHILVLPKGGTTDEAGQTTYSEAEWETCRQEAQEILIYWKEGLADEDFFAELANERSEDPGSNTNGGLYSYIYKGQMVEPFEQWCFDESRQYGDTGLVQTSYGYHVMFYVHGDEGWFRAAEQSYITDHCAEILKQAQQDHPLEVTYNKIRLGQADKS